MSDYTPYQQKVIGRYYDNFESIKLQRLSELCTEVWLAEGKKKDKMWAQVGEILTALKVPQSRIDHVMGRKDPSLLPDLVTELSKKLGK
jgi:hypothetical protein